MFEAIGTLHSYAQQYQLKKSAKQKVKTGQSFDWKDAAKSTFVKAKEEPRETKSVFELYGGKVEKNDDVARSARKSGIKQKLRRGKKLSPQDLEYLRQTDEALYEKAKKTMEEREKLERALKAAKTKAEAQRAVAIAYANAAALMSGNIGGGGGGAAAGVSAGGGEAVGADAGATANAEGGASSFDAGTAVSGEITATAETGAAGTEAASTDAAVSAEGAAAESAAEATTGAEAVSEENDAATSETVAQENKDAVSSLHQMSQDTEFDDPLILLVLRHLKAEWNDFMRTKAYRDLPEDEIQEAKRHGIEEARRQRRAEGVKAVSLTAVASAYQTAKLDGETSRVLGSVGATN